MEMVPCGAWASGFRILQDCGLEIPTVDDAPWDADTFANAIESIQGLGWVLGQFIGSVEMDLP